MGRREQNTGFSCVVCEEPVSALTNGSYRNHCPFCLSSLHVDVEPGDRASGCRGVMNAVDVVWSSKGWQLVHRCRACSATKRNRIAPDDDVVRIAHAGLG